MLCQQISHKILKASETQYSCDHILTLLYHSISAISWYIDSYSNIKVIFFDHGSYIMIFCHWWFIFDILLYSKYELWWKAHKEYPCISHDKILPYFKSSDRAFTLLHGDCIELLKQFSFKFDMIFADPPYFLSNGGISVQSGKIVCVDKGMSWKTKRLFWINQRKNVTDIISIFQMLSKHETLGLYCRCRRHPFMVSVPKPYVLRPKTVRFSNQKHTVLGRRT